MNTLHNIYIGHMFEYEHERVCFARIGECDGGMSATIVVFIVFCRRYASALGQTIIMSRMYISRLVIGGPYSTFDPFWGLEPVHANLCNWESQFSC